MTKKDFVLIAATIAAYRIEITGTIRKANAADEMATRFADEFEKAFPRFNRNVFLKACGAIV